MSTFSTLILFSDSHTHFTISIMNKSASYAKNVDFDTDFIFCSGICNICLEITENVIDACVIVIFPLRSIICHVWKMDLSGHGMTCLGS